MRSAWTADAWTAVRDILPINRYLSTSGGTEACMAKLRPLKTDDKCTWSYQVRSMVRRCETSAPRNHSWHASWHL